MFMQGSGSARPPSHHCSSLPVPLQPLQLPLLPSSTSTALGCARHRPSTDDSFSLPHLRGCSKFTSMSDHRPQGNLTNARLSVTRRIKPIPSSTKHFENTKHTQSQICSSASTSSGSPSCQPTSSTHYCVQLAERNSRAPRTDGEKEGWGNQPPSQSWRTTASEKKEGGGAPGGAPGLGQHPQRCSSRHCCQMYDARLWRETVLV